jgi:flagellar motility protein MotE (MotC chaperone)
MTARMTPPGKRAGRSVLMILAVLLASSGALRMGAGVGVALASGPETAAPEAATALSCPEPPLALAEALRAREDHISSQEAALADRLAALALAETAIEGRLAEMTAAEAKLSATLALADGAAENDLGRLTAVYEAMKPKDAAALFETMAPEFAAGFLGRMRPEAAAAVMTGLAPETAYGISVLLAGRNASVPKN